MRQFQAEVFTVFLSFEVIASVTPIGNGVYNAVNQLTDAGFALRRTHTAMKILADDDIGGSLRPIGGDFDIALLEKHRAFVVPNGSGPLLPGDLIVGGSTRFEFCGEETWKRHAGAFLFLQRAM